MNRNLHPGHFKFLCFTFQSVPLPARRRNATSPLRHAAAAAAFVPLRKKVSPCSCFQEEANSTGYLWSNFPATCGQTFRLLVVKLPVE